MTKSSIDKQLSKILSGDVSSLLDNHVEGENDIDDIEQVEELLPVVFEQKSTGLSLANEDIQADYEFARSNLYGLIGRSNAALELALKISAMSENPRALEVVATLIKMSGDVSKDLISIHQAIEKTKGNGGGNNQPPSGSYTQVNNNYYNTKEEVKDVSDILDDLPDDK